jgi:hypothetical protein
VMEGSDTVFIVGVLVFVSGVGVNGVLLVDTVIVGGVLSLDVESERKIVSSKVEVLSVSVTTVSGVSSFSPTLADVR